MIDGFRIGVDLGGTKIEAVLIDPAGVIVERRRIATPAGDAPATIRAVASLVAALDERVGAPAPVGIGIPGSMSPATGLVRNANSTCLIGLPLDRLFAEALGRSVRLANDADCFALSEATDGAGAGAGIVFGVILGTGCGGGIVVGGRLLSGPNRIAGEWGHNPLPWPQDDERPGPRCYCGRRGCIETFLCGPALAADGGAEDVPAVIARAERGDAQAAAALDRHAERLARALAAVINLLDPDVIVLGGGLGRMARLYDAVPRLWGAHVFSDTIRTRLVPPVHGDSSGVRGAAWLWR